MDIKAAVQDSFGYAKETVWGAWKRWIILVIMSIIFPFMLGYTMEIYRGRVPPPELENWGRLFVDGLKYIAAIVIYLIPVIIIIIASLLPVTLSIISKVSKGGEFAMDVPELAPFILPVFGGILLSVILGIIITLISTIGIIRMARTDSFKEAFNFSAILNTIRSIGWGSYILAQIVLWIIVIIYTLVTILIEEIPYLGFVISLFIGVILSVFEARYFSIMYDSAQPELSAGSEF